MTYESAWWSIDVADGWTAEENESCVTLVHDEGVGALQLSAARKGTGPITEEELEELARDRVPAEVPLAQARLGWFAGLGATHERDETAWREWWVSAGSLMVYATYNCDPEDRGQEDAAIDAMLATLRPRTAERPDRE